VVLFAEGIFFVAYDLYFFRYGVAIIPIVRAAVIAVFIGAAFLDFSAAPGAKSLS
jgi:hypothetical protein